jgi:hypothetical protein
MVPLACSRKREQQISQLGGLGQRVLAGLVSPPHTPCPTFKASKRGRLISEYQEVLEELIFVLTEQDEEIQ